MTFHDLACSILLKMHCVKSVRIRSYSRPCLVRMLKNTDQNNSEYGHFLRSKEEAFALEIRTGCLSFLGFQGIYWDPKKYTWKILG